MTTPEKGLPEGKSNRGRPNIADTPVPVDAELVSDGTSDLDVLLDGRGIERVTDLAVRAHGPHILEEGRVYAFLTEDGRVEDIDLRQDQTLSPTRKAGTVSVQSVGSFLDYVARHSTSDTEVYCGVTPEGAGKVVAVLNAGGAAKTVGGNDWPGMPGYGDHRVTLDLTPAPEWVIWSKGDRNYLTQTDFAELLEDRMVDVVEPSAGDLLEIVTTLEATTKADFRSAIRLRDGQRSIEYVETIESKAGQKGTMTIPEKFTLALRPFLGCDRYRVEVRLRFRLTGDKLSIGYVLDRPADILEKAFGDIVGTIETGLEDGDVPVFAGFPAPPRPQA